MSPVTSAFLAALALPFYRYIELQPHFPWPTFQRRRQLRQTNFDLARQYVKDLPYYMTLSTEPRSVGSTIWSMFWQPEVECNLVSPWLSSTLSILKPIVDAGDQDLLMRIFALRRPRVALWWQGLFLLGNPTIPAFILRYLDCLEEQSGCASMAVPDTTASAWTGSAQTFLDEKTDTVYANLEDRVPAVDLLKRRYTFRLQDPYYIPLAWRPFGSFPKRKVELDLWPWLERQHTRRYAFWVWWIKGGEEMKRDIQHGFSCDTRRFLPIAAADEPEMAPADASADAETVHDRDIDRAIKLGPSLQATLRMLDHCMDE